MQGLLSHFFRRAHAFIAHIHFSQSVGWENMAFVYFNRYLDLVEAIEESSPDMLDDTEFAETDIPLEIPLPEKPHLTVSYIQDLLTGE